MGCSESLNTELKLIIKFNTPIFKLSSLKTKVKGQTYFRDFCDSLISLYLNPEFQDLPKSITVHCNGQSYSSKDCRPICEYRFQANDIISINAKPVAEKPIELTLKIFYSTPKEITVKVPKSSNITSLIEYDSKLRPIKGDIELNFNHKIDDYDFVNKSKIFVLVKNFKCDEIQI